MSKIYKYSQIYYHHLTLKEGSKITWTFFSIRWFIMSILSMFDFDYFYIFKHLIKCQKLSREMQLRNYTLSWASLLCKIELIFMKKLELYLSNKF